MCDCGMTRELAAFLVENLDGSLGYAQGTEDLLRWVHKNYPDLLQDCDLLESLYCSLPKMFLDLGLIHPDVEDTCGKFTYDGKTKVLRIKKARYFKVMQGLDPLVAWSGRFPLKRIEFTDAPEEEWPRLPSEK